ncbi:MAG: hypothetical protein ACI9HK_001027 [Pirellulaceae bacterium]|jgi:hypothetical protein
MMRWLLGIEPADWAEDGQLRFEWLSTPSGDRALLLLLAGIAAVLVVWFLYRWEGARLSRSTRLLMVVFRLIVVAVTIAMLCEPVAVLSKSLKIPSHILVLIDDSLSMQKGFDTWNDDPNVSQIVQRLKLDSIEALNRKTRSELTQQIMNAEWLKSLSGDGQREVHVHYFAEMLADQVKSSETALESEAGKEAGQDNKKDSEAVGPATAKTALNGRQTALGTSLRQAITAYQGLPLAGVVVISDGQSNSGETLKAVGDFADQQQVPVFALAMGTKRGPRDINVLKLDANEIAFIKDVNKVEVLVKTQGMEDSGANIVLEKRRNEGVWEQIGQEPIENLETGVIKRVEFQFQEAEPGKLELRARVEEAGPELTIDNNVAIAEVQLIPQKLRVLFIAGSTFPEVQFLRNTLMRDKGIDVATWNQSADKTYEHPGDSPIRRLPETEEELDQYDCIVMYDPDPKTWPGDFARLLNHFVSFDGGGLIYIAGEMQTKHSFDNPTAPEMAWVPLLPVVREPGLFRSEVSLRLSAQNAWRLSITDEGQRDFIFQFADTPDANKRVLGSLPGMFWHFPVTRAKAGATVLARHGDPRMRNEFGPEVLLATHRVGPGRVFFVGFDSTYRWRYIDEQTFDGFWARMIDRAGRNKQLGGGYPFRLRTDKLTYEPGEQIRLTASLISGSLVDADISSITAELEHGSDPLLQVTLNPSGREGEFAANVLVDQAGPYIIKAWAGQRGIGGDVRTVTRQIMVELPNAEFEKPTLDRASLELVAELTGGRVFGLHETDLMAGEIRMGQVDKLVEDRNEIWNAPIFFVVIVLGLTVEWILRKRFQLV